MMDKNNQKIGKWNILESKYLIKRPWLTARCDKVELPSGVTNDEYYVLEYPKWANVIAITEEGNFVMVEQYRHGLGEVLTELCAGVVEDGEDPMDAAKRELAEETGYTGGSWELWSVISANPGSLNNLNYCFIATGVKRTGSQHLDATEDLRVVEMSRDEVISMLLNDELKQALMAAPLWKYFATRSPLTK